MSRNTTLEERIEIMELAQAGIQDSEIAQRLGWSESTIRKWRRRGQNGGREALVSLMGRPRQGAMSSYPAEIRETVRRRRESHPGWGAKTLYTEMTLDERLAEESLPSPATIGRFLHEQGLTRPYERHCALPQSERVNAAEPHAVWEMDARGYSHVPDVGVVTLIDLNDRFSRLRLLSYPCLLGKKRASRHATTEDYQIALRLAFTDWGLPHALQVDHESVFYDNRSKSPFPTRIHQWLLALGVRLTFGRPGVASDQGMTERSHQTWDAQVLAGQRYSNWLDLYRELRQRRDFLNYHMPCDTLDGQAPLQAYPQAGQSSRPYRPEWEMHMLDLGQVSAYLAEGRWFRLVGTNGTVSLGSHVYYVGYKRRRHQLEIAFDPADLHLVFSDEAGDLVKRMPLQGLETETLMGELVPFVTLPEFQPYLPFTWESQRVIRLFDSIEA